MSADGDIVRAALDCAWATDDDALAALARLEADQAELIRARAGWDGWQANAFKAEAQRDALAEALRTICDIGETRDVEVARAALADVGLIADSDTTTEWKS